MNFEPILRKLTVNAALTLKCRKNPDDGECVGRMHTGLGKYTHLAALGVIANLRVNGLIEERGKHAIPYFTPIGVEVAQYLAANWDAVYHMLRDPRFR